MDQWLSRIVALLEAGDPPVRRAAATVLGALAPSDKEVVTALTASLAAEDHELKLRVLDALAAIGAPAAFDAVAPLLDERGELGIHAREALAAMGGRILTRLRARFEGAGSTARRRILGIAARLRGASGFDLLMRALEEGHADMVLEAGQRLSEELSTAGQRERSMLVGRLEKFLDSPRAREDAAAAAAAVDLLARSSAGEKEAIDRLASYCASGNAPAVRQRSLEGLARIATRVALPEKVLDLLIACLGEPDFTHVVSPSIQVLERAQLTAAHTDALLRCLAGGDPALRRFAISALGRVESPRSAKALLEVLKGDNPDLQRRAAEALTQLGEAAGPTAAALASAPDARVAWIYARILQPRLHQLKGDHVSALAKAAAAWLEPGDPRAEAVVSVLRERHRDALAAAVIRRVGRLKRDRSAGEIVNLLRPLGRSPEETDANTAYELALAEVVRGSKEVIREARLDHPGLRTLEMLAADADFDLLARLRREKNYLEPAEYYLIGCHFAERSFADRALGGALLAWLVRTFPEDPAAAAASNKLLMEGFPPPPQPRPRKKKTSTRKKTARPALAPSADEPKKAPAKKPPAKKPPAKKPPAKKPPTKKPPTKKPPAKKAPAKKAPTKKPPAPKPPTKKAPTKKAPTKKPPAKKAPAKKAPAPKKTAAKKGPRR